MPWGQGGVYDLHFSVRDTGIGIPQDRQDRLFKSFSQLDASTTRKYGGTGLGLVISKRLVEMMGGSMWVESPPDSSPEGGNKKGQGTTFHFTIRAQTAESTQPVYLKREQPSLEGKRVLIVDDNATNRQILFHQTTSWGMKPSAVDSGQAALEKLNKKEVFDLIIVDMHMPDMDGLTLATKIRRDLRLCELPLIMLASLGQHDRDQRLKEFTALLSKPVKPSQLYNSIRHVLVGESRQQADLLQRDQGESGVENDMGERHPLRLLLAEDNSTNQQLALLTLQRLGYRADVAANGLEVLELLRQHSYDLIFMDVQMPEMDGLEATRVIRREFPPDMQPSIVAMTANAMHGDRETCLSAGMDDYISKPFEVQDLVEALKKCPVGRGYVPDKQKMVRRGYVPDEQTAEPKFQTSNLKSQIINPAAITRLQTILGKQATTMLPMLIENFFKDAVTLQQNAQQAFEQGKPEELCRAAHTLKSAGQNFGAKALVNLCQTLENSARTGNMEEVEELLTQIKMESTLVQTALNHYKNSL